MTLNLNVKAISKANLVQWNILSCCHDLQLGVSGPFSSIIPSNMSRRVDRAVSTSSSALHNVRHISVSSPAPAYLSATRESSAGVCCLTSTSKERSLYLGPSDDAMQKMGFHESETLFYHRGPCQPPLKGRLSSHRT